MANNHDIEIHDFENICRTCLSRENLKPLYEKCVSTTCLVDMLMSCTFVKFTEEDGLPMNICRNCINEIKLAFAFGKRCEATDTILRECIKNFKTQPTKEVNLIIKPEEEMIPAETDVGNYEFVNVDIKEEDVQEEFEEYIEKEQDANLEIKYDETFEDPAVKTSTNSQIKEGNLKDKRSQLEPVRLFETNDQMYRCQTCEKSYKRLDLLKLHQKRSHASKKSHVCEVCSKTFFQSSDLKIHMRVHTGEKPYTCEVCSHNFTQSQSLRDHMRIHTGEKTYTCKVCKKTFNFSGNLKTHMRVHTGERPYVCKVCSKTFTHISHLKIHIRTHTGEKPYTCKVCSNTFKQNSHLKVHIRRHAGVLPYTCEDCGKGFSVKAELTVHKHSHTKKI